MKRRLLLLVGIVAGGAILAGVRGVAAPAPGMRAAAAVRSSGSVEERAIDERASAAMPPRPPEPIDVPGRMEAFEGDEIGRIEEEFEARVLEDPAFAAQLFDAFLAERDPVRMSFLQNVIASNAHLRNSPEWQARFMGVAESDERRERRIAALLFLQQAEAIAPTKDRLFLLAATGGAIRVHALLALAGLPGRRAPDPRLVELAGTLAATESDPGLVGLALRIEGSPDRAGSMLAHADREVRMQAAQVVVSRDLLEAALRRESDAEVRDVIARRAEFLAGSQ